MEKRMMAAVLHKIGEQLRIETLKVPKLKAEEVTVRIRAAGMRIRARNSLKRLGIVTFPPLSTRAANFSITIKITKSNNK